MPSRPVILFYCQHVLGMGHFVRSMELVRGLQDFQVCFFNGGESVPGFPLPPSVEMVQLPPLTSNAACKTMPSTDHCQSLAEIKDARIHCLLDGYERLNPDLVIIELFPFGRKQFAFELVPLLARVRLAGRRTKVVCSLRDILVSKRDQQRYEARVCALLNRYFDALLIHADPQLQRLEETFSSVNAIQTEIKYTGYVVQTSDTALTDLHDDDIALETSDDPFILVSIGGGRVGYELLACAVKASEILAQHQPHHMLVFTGPYLPEEQFRTLKCMTENKPYVTLRRYTARFLSYMEQADVSVSMAGYNTCMNILTTGVTALVLPFIGGGDNEQTIRAKKLEELGVVNVMQPQELQPARLAENIMRRLRTKASQPALNLRGVESTAAFVSEVIGRQDVSPLVEMVSSTKHTLPEGPLTSVNAALRSTLEQMQEQEREVRVFLRDDDIDEDEARLRQLLDIAFSRGVPINLAIIPARLTDAAVRLLQDYKSFQSKLIELHQHGWQHVNHEKDGKKSEFGPARCIEEQLQDITRGKARLEAVFGDTCFPAFTPPWNRCTEDTLKILDQLGFLVLSRDHKNQPLAGYDFREISVTLDLFRWKGGVAFKSPEEITQNFISQIGAWDVVGILLHHKVMDGAAFSFLDVLLDRLCQYPNVQFHTFQSLLQQVN